MILKRILSAITRTERNKINENWSIIEKSFNVIFKVGEEMKDSAEFANQKADKANSKSEYAIQTADIARNTAEGTQQQLQDIIIQSGTSDAETIAARTNTITAETHKTLDARLDSDYYRFRNKIIVQEAIPIAQFDGDVWFQTGLGELTSGDGDGGVTIFNAELSDDAPKDNTKLWLDYD